MEPTKKNVLVYVDGFNLYFGIKDAGYLKYKWLNIHKLVTSFLSPEQNLVDIKYFTSRVKKNPIKQKRQSTYIEALETTGIKVIYGLYKPRDFECENCGYTWQIPNEKMTDVNIATEMLVDSFNNKFDVAILISGDSDLVPPIKAVKKIFPEKIISVFFPPNRYNVSVASVVKGSLIIGRNKLTSNQFPDEIVKENGFVLKKPHGW